MLFFVPISLVIVLPYISQDHMMIVQQTPTGEIASLSTNNLKATTWEIIILVLPFNIFYGLIVGIIIKSLNERYLYSLAAVDINIK